MTASFHRAITLSTAAIVAMPTLATVAGVGPMGYHSGTALLVRVVAVLGASVSFAGVLGIAGYLYWLHVIAPAPAAARPAPVNRRESRGLATQAA